MKTWTRILETNVSRAEYRPRLSPRDFYSGCGHHHGLQCQHATLRHHSRVMQHQVGLGSKQSFTVRSAPSQHRKQLLPIAPGSLPLPVATSFREGGDMAKGMRRRLRASGRCPSPENWTAILAKKKIGQAGWQVGPNGQWHDSQKDGVPSPVG